ncbi:MAG TPA: UDP-glucose/GDP-mannose dehydrogenase family protein [Phycisphaerae bacterium]|nr:UDP-glucose/GDP-mannose dehydrogenase family protein [Phycisphaerae bacterium]
MKIAVMGCGYVGLVSGTCLASLGHKVIGVDVDQKRVDALSRGEIPIYEPGLSELIRAETAQGRLRFSTNAIAAIRESPTIFIAVGTPPAPSGGADLSMLFAAAQSVTQAANGPKTLVIKSTVPPGTGEKIADSVSDGPHKIEVVNNPEFLREGTAIQDFMQPDRIIFGANSTDGLDVLREIYQPLIDRGYTIFSMNRQSAELAKFAANAMLAMRISFINELSQLAHAVGADIESVRVGIGTDKRIGPAFLKAGVGYGGSCFPKDVAALVYQMQQIGIEPHLLAGIEKVNSRQKELFAKRIADALVGIKDPQVAVWGLAFKPDTDDMRESPSIDVIKALLKNHVHVRAYDPQAMANARKILGDAIVWSKSLEECTKGVDAIVLVTDWPEFITQDWKAIASLMRGNRIFDGRNCLASGKVSAAGLHYHAIGRQEVAPMQGKPGSMGFVSAG